MDESRELSLANEEEDILLDDAQSQKELDNMYLTFVVGDEVYGLDIKHVIQIINMQPITILPEMDYCMIGMIRFREGILPVVSMRMRFNKPEAEYDDRTCIIVCQIGGKRVGLIVDQIQETLTIEPEDILPPPGTSQSKSPPYIKGLAKIKRDGSIKILLSLKYLLPSSDFNYEDPGSL